MLHLSRPSTTYLLGYLYTMDDIKSIAHPHTFAHARTHKREYTLVKRVGDFNPHLHIV